MLRRTCGTHASCSRTGGTRCCRALGPAGTRPHCAPCVTSNTGMRLRVRSLPQPGTTDCSRLVTESDRFLHNQRLGFVVAKPGAAWANDFFFHVFNLARVRAEIHASASGVKVRHTSPSKIGAVRVSFPATVAEQREIASNLIKFAAECDLLASVVERRLTALDELKKSLLHQAFTCALTVKETDQQLKAAA